MRPAMIPRSDRPPFWRCAFRWYLLSFLLASLAAFAMPGCSPRAFTEINKQAPEPPYAGQRHSGLDRAQYLRDTEPLDYE